MLFLIIMQESTFDVITLIRPILIKIKVSTTITYFQKKFLEVSFFK